LAIWHPEKILASVAKPKGVMFQTMGFSSSGKNGALSLTWLYPEEALLMVERGSMILKLDTVEKQLSSQHQDQGSTSAEDLPKEEQHNKKDPSIAEMVTGAMSLQQAYSQLLGPGRCSLEKYQVLRRCLCDIYRFNLAAFRYTRI
jgi:hypothetical protein